VKSVLVIAAVLASFFLVQWVRPRPDPAEAHLLVEAGATLVDVRTPEEFASGHLPGAVNIPVDELPRRFRELGEKQKPVVVYCRSGARSSRAEGVLEENGFQHVHNLGPMSAW
jgi:rhodanese-related sulfurtransferase